MPPNIPQDVVQDVETMIGEGIVKRGWYARRIAAYLRAAGFVATPDWLDANEQTYKDNWRDEIDKHGR